MPYEWTPPADQGQRTQLRLWPHNSLPKHGFAAFILTTFVLISLPLFIMLGTILMWGLLPFVMLTVAGMFYALQKNERDRQIEEILTVTSQELHLRRTAPRQDTQEWACNPYWAQVALHETGGPIPNYVTLKGSGREVEIGAFLSEEERKGLFDDLTRLLRRLGPET
ncbi:MAG: DUF2244 domain-containing protein [Rhodobacteraceae bacterium]|nr:DUF2244 domain-containing protein [Paracoccaceae bacterium]